MQFIRWLKIYELDVPILDYQHKNLIFILNDTYRLFAASKKEKDLLIGEVLDNFIKFYKEHFTTEEKFMELIDYDLFQHHKYLHDNILDRLYEYKNFYNKTGKIDLENFLTMLNDWIFEHLTIEDMKLREHTRYIDEEIIQKYNQKLGEIINGS